MKQRWGFVSNSSSSSFILAVRKGHSLDEMLPPKGTYWRGFAERVVDFLQEVWSPHDDVYKYAGRFWTTPEQTEATLREVIGPDWENWNFGAFSAYYNQGSEAEMVVGRGMVNCRTENIILQEGSL